MAGGRTIGVLASWVLGAGVANCARDYQGIPDVQSHVLLGDRALDP